MSISLMAEVWKTDLPTGQKMVLLALADCANDSGSCWPSMATIAEKASMGVRTAQGCIKALVAAGYLSREERAGKGCFYVVTVSSRDNSYAEAHYVYRVTNSETGEFYIGARSFRGLIESDPYLGSGNWVKRQKQSGATLGKEVLEICDTRDGLALAELRHVAAVFEAPNCRNERLPTPATLTKTDGRLTPADFAPRKFRAPQKTTRTPADSADKPSRTIIGDKAKASSPQRGAAKPDANRDERAKRKTEKAAARALWVKPDFADTDELADVWADFLINRETKNLPWTATAYRGQLRKIDELAQQLGQPPGDVLRECVEQGWGGVHDFTERRNGGSQRARDNRTGRRGSSGGGFSGASGRVDGFGAGLREAGTSLADAAAGDAPFGG